MGTKSKQPTKKAGTKRNKTRPVRSSEPGVVRIVTTVKPAHASPVDKYQMFAERYAGTNGRVVAAMFNVAYSSYRKAFMRGGKWYDEYETYRIGRETSDHEAALNRLKNMVGNAVETLEDLLTHHDGRVRGAAVKEILDRNLGKALQPLGIGELDGSTSIMQLMAERRRQKEENANSPEA